MLSNVSTQERLYLQHAYHLRAHGKQRCAKSKRRTRNCKKRRGHEKKARARSDTSERSDTMAAIIERVLSCFQSKPKKFRVVFVLGGPGSGKGTLCSKIVETYGWVHLCGRSIEGGTEGPVVKARRAHQRIHREGKIVPVEITLALIRKAMEASATTDFLVDGFPRSADN